MTDRVRRNGSLSSCEPCRHSKLRCDHNRPICGRCVRRGLPQSRCHYQPAPMAKRAMPKNGWNVSPHQQSTESVAASRSNSTGVSRAHEPINISGPLMCFNDPNTPHMQRAYTTLTRTGVAVHQAPLPSRHTISEGAKLLEEILDLVTAVGETLETPLVFDPDSCFQGPLIDVAWKETHEKIRALIQYRSTTDLEMISQEIFAQTSLDPVFPPTAAAGAFESAISAHGLRWELIGIYCARIGILLGGEKHKSPNSNSEQPLKLDRKALMQSAFRICIKCESYCDYIGAINDFTFTFLLLAVLFATWCFGDDSYHVLRLQGSMTSVFLALGFHRGVGCDPSVPFYMAELRKRGIAWAHDHDKVLASFTSRPPRLSRFFCVVELPLELPDSIIMGTEELFLKARENLDDRGWSESKDILPVSRMRVQLILSMIREEALELKIGPAVPDLEPKVLLILQKLKSTWQSLPAHMKLDTAQHWKSDAIPTIILQGIRLDYLYTEFLLRTLLAVNKRNREGLILTAHEIVSLVLLPMRKRSFLYKHRADLEFFLVFYAMPCASVLILELLREKQHPEERLPINRSGIIQDISVLISSCDSLTQSGHSNYQMCKQAQSIFSRSLDEILNQKEPTQKSQPEPLSDHLQQHSDQDYHGQANPTKIEASNDFVQDHEWMLWLDSVGLQADSWLDSIVPTQYLPMDYSI